MKKNTQFHLLFKRIMHKIHENRTLYLKIGWILSLIMVFGCLQYEVPLENKPKRLEKEENFEIFEISVTENTKIPNDKKIKLKELRKLPEILNIRDKKQQKSDDFDDSEPILTHDVIPDDPYIDEIVDEPFRIVEKMPEFEGGLENFYKFIQKNIKYPKIDVENNIEGVVYVQFIIEKDGAVSNVEILRGVSSRINAEAIRVVKLSPKWIAGEQRNIPVRVYYTLPIRFSLQ